MEREWAREFPADDPFNFTQAGLEDAAGGGEPDYALVFTPEAIEGICEGEDDALNATERTLRIHAKQTPQCVEYLATLRAEQARRGLEPWPANYQHPGAASQGAS